MKNIVQDKDGTAMVEFALALPMLLSVTLIGTEFALYTTNHFRASQVAATTADAVARVRSSIDETDINDIFRGVELSGNDISFLTRGRVRVTMLELKARSGTDLTLVQKASWQRCKGTLSTPTVYTVNETTGMGPTGSQIVASTTNPIVFVEVQYQHNPIITFASRYISFPNMRYTSAHTVRSRSDQTLSNRTSLTGSAVATC